MPRRPRFCPAGLPVHVVQRGNNRQVCFAKEGDLAAYANWLAESADKFNVDVHGWVLMTNHVHLLVTPQSESAVSQMIQTLGRLYVRHFNYAYQRTGTLFEGRFKSSVVQQQEYLLNCLRYIELNPVRAGMVKDPGDYKWSSYRAHAFGTRPTMWTPHEEYLTLGQTEAERQSRYQTLVSEAVSQEVTTKIRQCLNTGLVLGSDRFREQVAALSG
ncbi:MAG: transposase [Pseudomonadaceae bacterium]|nr:transposase [Pseudomonadaceae bacterium]